MPSILEIFWKGLKLLYQGADIIKCHSHESCNPCKHPPIRGH